MGKFKVGDKVRCIEDGNGNGFTKGKVYEVRCEVTKFGSLGIVKDDQGSVSNGWGHEFFEPAMPKFKVGDRVRDVSGLLKGNIDSVVRKVYGNEIDVLYDIDKGKEDKDFEWLQPESEFELIEPAPLFAVGDKVRWKGSCDKTSDHIVTRVYVTDGDRQADVHSNTYGRFTNVPMSALEHATTDEEAVPLFDPRTSGWTGTTGFTIPTDEEALPPKVVKRRAKAPFVFDGGVLKLDHVSTGVVSASILRDRNGDYIDLVNKRIVINDNKPKPRPAIVALVENGQPLPADKPKVHKSTTKATKEANRLAARYPGQEFGVFELVSKRVATVDIREAA